MKPVKVTAHPETGAIITPFEKNPEFGAVGVEQETITYNESGFLNRSKRTALIRGRVSELEEMNYKEGQILPGKIIVKESTSPAYDGHDPKINPTTGEVLMSGDHPIYRQTFYTENLSTPDSLVQHTNVNTGQGVNEGSKREVITEELA